MLVSTTGYARYESFMQDLLSQIVIQIGWPGNEGMNDFHNTDLIRSNLFPFALRFESQYVIQGASLYWSQLKQNIRNENFTSNPIPPSARETVYKAAVKYGTDADYWLLLDLYQSTIDPSEQRRILHSLGSTRDYNLLIFTLQMSMNSSLVRSQDVYTVIAGVAYNPLGIDLAWDFIRSNWDFFNNAGFGIDSLVSTVTNKMNDQLHLDEVIEFFGANGASGAEMTVSQSIETIRNNIAWVSVNLATVSQWLLHYQTN
jgi:aminopeptidase N